MSFKQSIWSSSIEHIEKSGVEIQERAKQKIASIAATKAENHLVEQCSKFAKIQDKKPYMKAGFVSAYDDEANSHAILAMFAINSGEYQRCAASAWLDGNVIFTTSENTTKDEMLTTATSIAYNSLFRKMEAKRHKGNDMLDAFLDIMKNDKGGYQSKLFYVPEGIATHLIDEEFDEATQKIRKQEIETLTDLCQSDTELVNALIVSGSMCDGILTLYSSSIIRLANLLPMYKEEAKSYATHEVMERLEPFRAKAMSKKMSGWGSW